ncbi:MAG: 4Fe-4S binding protein [Eggerthella lenta]
MDKKCIGCKSCIMACLYGAITARTRTAISGRT